MRDKAETLITVIDHNLATKPKPFHHNFDLMTCALQLERAGVKAGEANVYLNIKHNKNPWWKLWK